MLIFGLFTMFHPHCVVGHSHGDERVLCVESKAAIPCTDVLTLLQSEFNVQSCFHLTVKIFFVNNILLV